MQRECPTYLQYQLQSRSENENVQRMSSKCFGRGRSISRVTREFRRSIAGSGRSIGTQRLSCGFTVWEYHWSSISQDKVEQQGERGKIARERRRGPHRAPSTIASMATLGHLHTRMAWPLECMLANFTLSPSLVEGYRKDYKNIRYTRKCEGR